MRKFTYIGAFSDFIIIRRHNSHVPLGGVPTDDDQATGLEREVMMAARKGLVRRKLLSVSSLELMAMDGTRAVSSLGALEPENLAVGTVSLPLEGRGHPA